MAINRQLRNEIAEHVTRGGKAMKQYNDRLSLIAGFAVEKFESINGHGSVKDFVCIHGGQGGLG
jgi:hypothetical protein